MGVLVVEIRWAARLDFLIFGRHPTPEFFTLYQTMALRLRSPRRFLLAAVCQHGDERGCEDQ